MSNIHLQRDKNYDFTNSNSIVNAKQKEANMNNFNSGSEYLNNVYNKEMYDKPYNPRTTEDIYQDIHERYNIPKNIQQSNSYYDWQNNSNYNSRDPVMQNKIYGMTNFISNVKPSNTPVAYSSNNKLNLKTIDNLTEKDNISPIIEPYAKHITNKYLDYKTYSKEEEFVPKNNYKNNQFGNSEPQNQRNNNSRDYNTLSGSTPQHIRSESLDNNQNHAIERLREELHLNYEKESNPQNGYMKNRENIIRNSFGNINEIPVRNSLSKNEILARNNLPNTSENPVRNSISNNNENPTRNSFSNNNENISIQEGPNIDRQKLHVRRQDY